MNFARVSHPRLENLSTIRPGSSKCLDAFNATWRISCLSWDLTAADPWFVGCVNCPDPASAPVSSVSQLQYCLPNTQGLQRSQCRWDLKALRQYVTTRALALGRMLLARLWSTMRLPQKGCIKSCRCTIRESYSVLTNPCAPVKGVNLSFSRIRKCAILP